MKGSEGWGGPSDGFARAQAAYDAAEPPYYAEEDDGEEGDTEAEDDA